MNGRTRLAEVCADSAVDFVTIAFVMESPEVDQDTGYPRTNFGDHCSGETYSKNGKSSHLLSGCKLIAEDIPKCQQMGKKVLLSIGGVFDDTGIANYTVSSIQNGLDFADFMWYAFGPYNSSWAGPRPFDLDETHRASVDGFDFDIEKRFSELWRSRRRQGDIDTDIPDLGDEAPWIAMIERLRSYFQAADSDRYLITGAPECPLNPGWFKMRQMIIGATFDILWIQFYNNGGCDAVNGGFNYDDWTKFLPGTMSAHAQLWIGLPAVPGSGYVEQSALEPLLHTYGTRPNFGGIMLWDSWLAVNNTDLAAGKNYLQAVREALDLVPAQPTTTVTTTSPPSLPTSPTGCSNTYTIKTKDYCYAIAEEYGITVSDILLLNPGLDSACDVATGEIICLPSSATTTIPAFPTPTEACVQSYKVRPGDYCYLVASKFGISVDELRALNPGFLAADCALVPGDILCVRRAAPHTSPVPTSNTTSSDSTSALWPNNTAIITSTSTSSTTPTSTNTSANTTTACIKYYEVVAGDYCFRIASKFGISVDQLRALNPTLNADCILMPGDKLCVKAENATTTTGLARAGAARAAGAGAAGGGGARGRGGQGEGRGGG